MDKCPWIIYCSKVGNLETYKVKTFIDSHSCQKEEVKEKFANTKWLGNMVIEDFRNHPKMTGEELKALIAEKYKVTISIAKAYRVKAYALQSIDGNVVQQYSRLSNYREELLRTNPGSTVELLAPKQCRNGPSRFDRIYICIDACRKGFLAGCRPLVALDGCHLTGYYHGQLLAAVALDGNNGLFIIAYAIVASETKDTWKWFLTNLLNDIGQASISEERWTFISDQGKVNTSTFFFDILTNLLPIRAFFKLLVIYFGGRVLWLHWRNCTLLHITAFVYVTYIATSKKNGRTNKLDLYFG